MKTESHSINDVLAKNATSFFIPPFQRAYAWGKPEIERYFSDLLRIIESEMNSEQSDKLEHFFGTIVIKEEKAGFANKSVIVDGQQRLTTTLLFLIALRDIETDVEKRDYIKQNYLINNASTFQDKIKLKQVTKDWDAYKALINNEDIIPGIISNAYQFFRKLIKDKKRTKPQIKLEHYIIALSRINVAVIFLDERPFKGEDPQIIFETLNSLGKPLTLSDLIRNFILLNMESSKQTEIYEKVWHPKIESILKENTSVFFRDYLQFKTASSIKVVSVNNTKEVYQIFKEFVEDNFDDHNDFIKDIIRYTNWYKFIISGEISGFSFKDNTTKQEIKELIINIFHDIKSEAFKPFVLGLLEYNQSGIDDFFLSDDLFLSILKTIRTYLIRRRILGLTQGENKNIVLLCNKIKGLSKGDTNISELLTNMTYRLRFPNDNEVRKELESINFYEGLKKYSKFILGKIEEHNTKVSVDFRDPKITIEHIMPQTLSSTWEKELGNNSEEIHKTYLHNIGNLILTEFNSEMGNKSFQYKKTMLNSSSLNYRLDIISNQNWNEQSILEHRDKMISWLIETFPLISEYRNSDNWNTKIIDNSEFSPLEVNSGDLAEGNKPKEIIIEGISNKVTTWQNVFIQFIKHLKDTKNYEFEFILENQTELFKKEDAIVRWEVLEQMIDSNFVLTNRYKSLSGKVWNNVTNLTDDTIFLHINISASTCINRISNIMNKFNMSEKSVLIVLK
jgi:uncharacterized protein with ParB-like and HNH nuclease domain